MNGFPAAAGERLRRSDGPRRRCRAAAGSPAAAALVRGRRRMARPPDTRRTRPPDAEGHSAGSVVGDRIRRLRCAATRVAGDDAERLPRLAPREPRRPPQTKLSTRAVLPRRRGRLPDVAAATGTAGRAAERTTHRPLLDARGAILPLLGPDSRNRGQARPAQHELAAALGSQQEDGPRLVAGCTEPFIAVGDGRRSAARGPNSGPDIGQRNADRRGPPGGAKERGRQLAAVGAHQDPARRGFCTSTAKPSESSPRCTRRPLSSFCSIRARRRSGWPDGSDRFPRGTSW